jgi:plastocyanin
MNLTRRLPSAAIAVAAALSLAACGGGGSSSGTTGAGSGSADTNATTNAIAIKNFTFSPKTVTVPRGTAVTWTNKDDVTHTVTGTGSAGLMSGDLRGGKTYTMTFNTAGTFSYMCSIHQYMHGTIVVR